MLTVPLKIAWIAIGTLLATIAGWTWAAVVAATEITGVSSETAFGTVIPAAALTGTSGALVWVVKQIVSGNLVHRDPAAATTKLTEALTKSNQIAERAIEREKLLTQIMLGRSDRAGDPTAK